jgi:hypothetical protein
MQANLKWKRDAVKRLQVRMAEAEHTIAADESDDEDEGEEEQVLGAPATAMAAVAGGGMDESNEKTTGDAGFSSNMRARRGGTTTTTTTVSDVTASGRDDGNDNDGGVVAGREHALDTDRAVQEHIMESLLSLTRELKSSANTFHGSLEDEKTLMSRAVAGLDRSADSMEQAGTRMGSLRRMTEGKGWIARMKLYGMIGGLWLVAFVVVFVLPKLRF